MCMICAALAPTNQTAGSSNHLPKDSIFGFLPYPSPTSGGGTTTSSGLDALTYQLTTGFWTARGQTARSFALDASREVSVDLSNLNLDAQYVARAALDAWTDVSGIRFVNASSLGGGAQIFFDDADPDGAYSLIATSGGRIVSSQVNIPADWDSDPVSLNSYWFQTYLHEIGHAIGLGHAGNYNGSAVWGRDNKFSNDSWQASVMSYFPQTVNPNTGGASFAFTATAMAADIIAIQALYGKSFQTRAGDTVYGNNSNVDGYLGDLFDQWMGGAAANDAIYFGNPITMTLFDTGGNDTLDVSGTSVAQRVDLNGEAKSDVAGLKGNIIIARGTVIENAIGGFGNDTISGNAAHNTLAGADGADNLNGRAGNDTLLGGAGNDTLTGSTGSDLLLGGTGIDKFFGGDQTDTVSYEGNSGGLLVDLTTPSLNLGEAAGDTFSSIEAIIAGEVGDSLFGSAVGNRLSGMGGNDQIFGRAGNDKLDGGAGDDALNGGTGYDTFIFASGADTVQDFSDNIDTISLALSLFGGGPVTVAEALAYAAVEFGNIVFRFSEFDTLTLTGRSNIAALSDDLIFA